MDIMKLMKQAQKLKKMQSEISNCTVEDEIGGAKLILSGSGKVKNFSISNELYEKGKNEIEKAAAEVIGSCFKKQVDLYKDKAKDAMGGMNLPDILG